MAAPAAVVLGCSAKTSSVAPPDAMLNAALVPVQPPLPAPAVSPAPVSLIPRFEHAAPPAAAATVAVPASGPPPGFVAIATVTFAVKLVTVLPSPSSTVTWTAGVIAAPATALVGSPVNTRAVPDPAETLNAALPPVARPVPLAVSV